MVVGQGLRLTLPEVTDLSASGKRNAQPQSRSVNVTRPRE